MRTLPRSPRRYAALAARQLSFPLHRVRMMLSHPLRHSHCRVPAHSCAADVDAGARCEHEHVQPRSDANPNTQSLCYALCNAGAMRMPPAPFAPACAPA
ncbi:hypothetical protein B0H12DRAFT_105940 [Mycena haematopus]|nr:hypothetical protein B0H12DRAFT_105940 [Mycena haematopus]